MVAGVFNPRILSFLFIDRMSGGFALAFIAFFLAVSSVAVSLMFLHRARATPAKREEEISQAWEVWAWEVTGRPPAIPFSFPTIFIHPRPL